MATAFLEGDRVEKGYAGPREYGIVVLATNRSTGEKFPLVWITDGPRKGQREYPWRGWRVRLDWPGRDDLQCRCRECERLFRAPRDEWFCWSCAHSGARR